MTVKEEVGTVVKIKGVEAVVRINAEASDTGKSQKVRIVDAWNNVSAKVGNKVAVEARDVEDKNFKFMFYGLPVLAFFAGVLFGGNLANYLDANVWPWRIGSGLLWLTLASVYSLNLRKTVKGKKQVNVIIRVLE